MSPSDFLVYVNKHVRELHGNIWEMADRMRAEKGKNLPDWPPYVFLPNSGWYKVTCELLNTETLREAKGDTAIWLALTVAGTWRVTQDVVRFDRDVYESIVNTELTGDIPYDVFYRMPTWCVWVETQGMTWQGIPLTGFWAMLDYSLKDNSDKLLLFFYYGRKAELFPVALPFGEGGILEGLKRMATRGGTHHALNADKTLDISEVASEKCITQAINLLLYICSYGFLERKSKPGNSEIRRPKPKKVKKGWRLYPAKRVTYHVLGEDIGSAIRAYYAAQPSSAPDTTASPRPHVRRAHWHGYWHGPRKAEAGSDAPERRFELRWLPPIPVAMSDKGDRHEKCA